MRTTAARLRPGGEVARGVARLRCARNGRNSRDAEILDPTAVVAESADIAPGVIVGPYAILEEEVSVGAGSRIESGAVIGAGASIGSHCRIYPRAVLYPGTMLGDRVLVHAGAVLGCDGFGYVRDEANGEYIQFPQQGRLIIEDDVEIGANATIDRGALAETRIARGAKLDNLVHIGHTSGSDAT